MSLRELHCGFRLDFETPEDQETSEDVLLRLMGLNARLNLHYLRNHPDTPPLYSSGVLYTPPDQHDGRPPLTKSGLKKLLKVLDELGSSPETALMVVRVVKGVEIFLDLPGVYNRRKGDCNELVPIRLAECWNTGIMASPYLIREPNAEGGFTYHVQMIYADGQIEDPSLILGMGGPECAEARREEIGKLARRWRTYVQAAQQLVDQGANAQDLATKIDAMGLVPRSGTFRSPYREAA